MEEKTLVITGMGAVTPIGIGVSAYWEALVSGHCGIGRISRFDASDLPVQIAAELKGFDPADHMPKTLARRWTRSCNSHSWRRSKRSRTAALPSNRKPTASAS